jgi:hypothetical protein
MPRPQAVTEDRFYDMFDSWEPDDQAVALRVMQQLHKRRRPKRETSRDAEPETAQLPLDSDGGK